MNTSASFDGSTSTADPYDESFESLEHIKTADEGLGEDEVLEED